MTDDEVDFIGRSLGFDEETMKRFRENIAKWDESLAEMRKGIESTKRITGDDLNILVGPGGRGVDC